MRKKLNKKIEFGGMTKHEAKAALLKNKNSLNKDNVKYNKSSNFFAEMNKEKKGKPNPNIGKLKIWSLFIINNNWANLMDFRKLETFQKMSMLLVYRLFLKNMKFYPSKNRF